MPEGHTIHRIASDHAKLLVGRSVSVSSPQGRFSADAALVDGDVLDRIEAYGKHLFLWWRSGYVGHVHLGLFGRFRVQKLTIGEAEPVPVGAVRMRLSTTSSVIDLAGPTACAIFTASERDAIVDRLGPDPLRSDAQPARAIERISRSGQALGALLLDQSVLCGVGNVYRAEALFVNGLHPSRRGRDTSPDELVTLWGTVVSMLCKGVKDNRIVTVDRRELGVSSNRRLRRGEATYVYHRDLCLRCGTPIQTVKLAGRPCYYCPRCQPS